MILRGTFGNFQPLSLATSAGVNLHNYKLTITLNARCRKRFIALVIL